MRTITLASIQIIHSRWTLSQFYCIFLGLLMGSYGPFPPKVQVSPAFTLFSWYWISTWEEHYPKFHGLPKSELNENYFCFDFFNVDVAIGEGFHNMRVIVLIEWIPGNQNLFLFRVVRHFMEKPFVDELPHGYFIFLCRNFHYLNDIRLLFHFLDCTYLFSILIEEVVSFMAHWTSQNQFGHFLRNQLSHFHGDRPSKTPAI